MDKKVHELLNDQVNKELYSAYLYLDMANFYDAQGLDGFANWFEIQAREEQDHAMLIYKYLHNSSEAVTLGAIAQPDKAFAALDDPLKAALEHERYVTSLIYGIYAAAEAVKDYRTMQFLDWFVEEQAEEEKNSQELLGKFALYARDGAGLHALNAELKGRAYAAPSLELD